MAVQNPDWSADALAKLSNSSLLIGLPRPCSSSCPGFALDGDVFAVAAAHRHAVNTYILPPGFGEVSFAGWPFGPWLAFDDVPFPNVAGYVDGLAFEPFAAGLVLASFRDRVDGPVNDVLLVCGLHRFQPMLFRAVDGHRL